MDHGTYSNGGVGCDLTLDALRATAEKIAALPRPESDITVAPDVLAAARRALASVEEINSPFPLRVHVDETVPAGHWHKGKPLAEQIREAALGPLPLRW